MDMIVLDNVATIVNQQVNIIRLEAGSIAESLWRVGQAVDACNQVIEPGKWDRFLTQELPRLTLVSSRTLRRQWGVYRRIPDPARFNEFPKMVMYLLTAESTPEEALTEILALDAPTPEDAIEIREKHCILIDVSENAAATMLDALEQTTDEVRAIVANFGAREPGVVRILEKYQEKELTEFMNIAVTGLLQWEGEKHAEMKPIPIATATTEGAAAVYASVRKAHGESDHEADKPPIHIKTNAYVLKAEKLADPQTGELRPTITFVVPENDMNRAIDILLGTRQKLIVQELKDQA